MARSRAFVLWETACITHLTLVMVLWCSAYQKSEVRPESTEKGRKSQQSVMAMTLSRGHTGVHALN